MGIQFAFICLALSIAKANGNIIVNNPQQGTVWSVNTKGYISWSGDCSSMGAAGKTVSANLVKGPWNAVTFVADLGTIDCTSAANTSINVDVPAVVSGDYVITIQTDPIPIYVGPFKIAGSKTSTSLTPTLTTTPTTSETTRGSLSVGSIVGIVVGALAIVGVAYMVVWSRRRRQKNKEKVDDVNGLGHGSAKIEYYQYSSKVEDMAHKEVVRELQNNIVGDIQTPPTNYTFNFSSHPRPNVVTIVGDNSQAEHPQESSTV